MKMESKENDLPIKFSEYTFRRINLYKNIFGKNQWQWLKKWLKSG